MASEEHQRLATLIKCVHKKLRDDTQRLGEKRAWQQHLQDAASLQTYSAAMHDLATAHWTAKNTSSDAANQGTPSKKKRLKFSHKEHSRIAWSVRYCREYFEGGATSQRIVQRNREARILSAMREAGETIDADDLLPDDDEPQSKRLKLLDVGSCYNPFAEFDEFEVIAIDIAPATPLVSQCDFLSVQLVQQDSVDHPQSDGVQLQRCSFDVIVFSLLLEYMPSSQQRLKCCQNAYDLLRAEGILIIITPDSKHVGANAKLVKNWRYALSLMGFSRTRIEKLEHLTCMVFRKAVNAALAHRWARTHKEEYMTNAIHIPQDFTAAARECE